MKTEHINRSESTCKLNICTQLCLRDCINEVSNKNWTQINRIKGYIARPSRFIVGFLVSANLHDNRIQKSPRVGLKSKLLNSNTIKGLQQEMLQQQKSGLKWSNQRLYIDLSAAFPFKVDFLENWIYKPSDFDVRKWLLSADFAEALLSLDTKERKNWTQINRIKGYIARPSQFIVKFLVSAYLLDNRILKSPEVELKSKLLNSNMVKGLQQEMRQQKSVLNRSNQRLYIDLSAEFPILVDFLENRIYKWPDFDVFGRLLSADFAEAHLSLDITELSSY